MNVAYINPEIVVWARKERGLTHAQLATSQFTSDQIEAWEQKRALPTYAQADALAKRLKLPFGMLFLSEPPTIEVKLPDLRTVSGAPPKNLSQKFLEVINSIFVRQDWYREFQHYRGVDVLEFVGRYSLHDDTKQVARDIGITLGIDGELRRQCNSWKEFLDLFIAKAEEVGILVFRSSLVGHATRRSLNLDEFRGFVLSDPIAPVVFINDNDAKAAQIFTLAHELAHIWIGKTGISDPRVKVRSAELTNAIERFCNRVAAELLVPESEMNSGWRSSRSIRENMETLAGRYRVSSLVILLRAYETGKINFEQFSPIFDEENRRFRLQDKKEKISEERTNRKRTGGNFWASFVIRNSRHFTDIVVTSAREGRSRYTDAASLLGIKAATLELYLKRLEASR